MSEIMLKSAQNQLIEREKNKNGLCEGSLQYNLRNVKKAEDELKKAQAELAAVRSSIATLDNECKELREFIGANGTPEYKKWLEEFDRPSYRSLY